MEKIIIYTHSDCLAKDNGPNHPERKERLETVLKSVMELDSFDIDIKEAPLAANETINLVHPQSHLNAIFSMIPSTGSPLCSSAIIEAKRGRPRIKERVPSTGSMVQTHSALAF